MLSNTLNTNQVKDSAGTEIEFSRLSQGPGATTEFAKISETPSAPHRLNVKHVENGVGMKKRRRSVVRFDYTSVSGVDSATPVTTSGYAVLDAPIGALTTSDPLKMVLANLMSFLATTGGGTTVLFDCTGSGADALLNAGL